ncbi:hypothetical protein GO730_23685 [Spirosoma sp. HMF3257]|uniref:YD repeat-containing protein n=1 Tax=Spirosoma telluris TaxID=2183553 RepID=A0A327NRG7_9BACT|nr:hypothetical protein [Spirosoma telluris]RAI76404.1 hypothetical protein HMF3257_23625 [Spirosoma telluris]
MRTFFTPFVVVLGLVVSLFACSDHRLGGSLSPARLRLKTVVGGGQNTTYSYDSQNRLATISKADGSLGVFSYGDLLEKYSYTFPGGQHTYFSEFPNAADRSTGLITPYPNVFDGTSFSVKRYSIINSNIGPLVADATFGYGFDASKRLTGYYKSNGNDDALFRVGIGVLSYTGENITKVYSASGRVTLKDVLLEYDDKINPFFGLMDPNIDPVQRFSRNNRVKLNDTNLANGTTIYEYEYNQQGLPTKRTAKQGSTVIEVLTYTYESY